MADIYTDYAEYSLHGLVSGDKNPGSISGNGSLFTAEKLFILKDNNALNIEQMNYFVQAINTYCVVVPGLLRRSDTYKDQEGHDDYVGVASAGALGYRKFAKDIIAYGQSHFYKWKWFKFPYYYDNEGEQDNDVRAEFIRYPQDICHLKWCAGIEPNVLLKIYWFLDIVKMKWFPMDQDGLRLTYLRVRSAPNRWYTNLAAKIFAKNLAKTQYKTMAGVYAAYFNNPNHPHAKWSIF